MRYHHRLIMIDRNDPCPCGKEKKFKELLATVRIGLIGPDLAIARNRPDTPIRAAERHGVLDSLVLA
jgi:hypothetical protein